MTPPMDITNRHALSEEVYFEFLPKIAKVKLYLSNSISPFVHSLRLETLQYIFWATLLKVKNIIVARL